jgi:DNA/RNA endonuclease YhcR with UshA esterase domain
MVAKNDITGDSIQTKGVTDAYRDNYDIIFNKKKKTDAEKFDEQVIMKEEHYDEDEE